VGAKTSGELAIADLERLARNAGILMQLAPALLHGVWNYIDERNSFRSGRFRPNGVHRSGKKEQRRQTQQLQKLHDGPPVLVRNRDHGGTEGRRIPWNAGKVAGCAYCNGRRRVLASKRGKRGDLFSPAKHSLNRHTGQELAPSAPPVSIAPVLLAGYLCVFKGFHETYFPHHPRSWEIFQNVCSVFTPPS